MITQCFNVNLCENMRDLFCIWNVKNNPKVQVTIKGSNDYKVQTKSLPQIKVYMWPSCIGLLDTKITFKIQILTFEI
jgi:hypothetical protein